MIYHCPICQDVLKIDRLNNTRYFCTSSHFNQKFKMIVVKNNIVRYDFPIDKNYYLHSINDNYPCTATVRNNEIELKVSHFTALPHTLEAAIKYIERLDKLKVLI